MDKHSKDIPRDKKILSELGFNSDIGKDHDSSIIIGTWEQHTDASKNFWTEQTYRIFAFSNQTTSPNLESIFPYVDPNDKPSFTELLSVIDQNQHIDFKPIAFRYKGPNNKTKDLLITAELISDKGGRSIYWQGTVLDITFRKEQEDKILDFAEGFIEVLKSMPSMIFAVDNQGTIVFWNNACETITGYKSSEIVFNKDALKLLYPDQESRRIVRSHFKEVGSKTISWEFELTTKSGATKTIRWKVYKNQGKIQDWNVIAIGNDITKLKKANKLLESQAREYEILEKVASEFQRASISDNYYQLVGNLLEKNLKDSLFVLCSADADEHFFSVEGVYGLSAGKWNQTLEALGWNPIGRRFQVFPEIYSIIGKGDLLPIEKSIYELTGGVVSSVASRNLERLFSIEKIYTMGLIHEDKMFGGVIVLTQGFETRKDLSIIKGILNNASIAIYRKNCELRLQDEKRRAEEADRLKSGFLANLSHEIRTPMNAILGFSQLLNLPNLTRDKRQQYIDIINSKGKMLVKLINDIIDVSKVESGELTLVNAPFKLNSLMRNLKAFYDKEKLFQEREAISIILSLPDNSDDFDLVSDEGRLEQILTNLLSNALKFTDKGSVEFGYNIGENEVEFFVKDTGVGIEEQMQKLIFDRFKQANEKHHRTEAGTGLGLAICKGIVELLKGRIWVESSPGMGANFRFTIPNQRQVIDSEDGLTEAIEIYKDIPDWKNKVLLIAEDEDINYLYISELLTPTGVNIVWAKDGQQAVELVSSIKNINAILMDIKMPIKNGYAATLEVRQINPHIPIIAQTAYAYTEDRSKAEAAGCDDYITKPINSNDLFAILDKYLG